MIGVSNELVGQARDYYAEALIPDDDTSDTVAVGTIVPLGGSGQVDLPLPGGSGTRFILSNVSGGQTIETPLTVDDSLTLASTGSAPALKIEAPGGGNYTALTTQAQTSNVTYTLPADEGTAGQILYTDGSGNLDWFTPGADTGFSSIGSTIFADKTAATSRTENADGTTVIEDPDLTVPVNANEDYHVEFVGYAASTSQNVDLNLALNIPSGASMTAHYVSFDHHTNLQGNFLLTADATPAPTAIQVPSYTAATFPPPDDCAMIRGLGIVRVGGTAGDITVMWAPDGGTTTPIMVGANSYLKITRIH